MELRNSGYFDPTRLFKNPKTMTNDELEQEYKASKTPEVFEVALSPNVSIGIKDEIKRHCFEVEQEYKSRKNEEWIYPLSEFFF